MTKPNAYIEDHREDWVALVSKRMAKKLPDLSAAQRRVLASAAFTRRYDGEITKPTIRYIGRDVRQRPVLERYEHGQWERWAVGRSGDPVDITEPIDEGRLW